MSLRLISGPRLKLKQKGETRVENQIFYCCVRVRVREERKKSQGLIEFRWSKFVKSRTKVRRID